MARTLTLLYPCRANRLSAATTSFSRVSFSPSLAAEGRELAIRVGMGIERRDNTPGLHACANFFFGNFILGIRCCWEARQSGRPMCGLFATIAMADAQTRTVTQQPYPTGGNSVVWMTSIPYVDGGGPEQP